MEERFRQLVLSREGKEMLAMEIQHLLAKETRRSEWYLKKGESMQKMHFNHIIPIDSS